MEDALVLRTRDAGVRVGLLTDSKDHSRKIRKQFIRMGFIHIRVQMKMDTAGADAGQVVIDNRLRQMMGGDDPTCLTCQLSPAFEDVSFDPQPIQLHCRA